jgi:hypothetical protein
MAREITTFPFPPTLKNKLLKGGFRYLSDFKGIKTVDLAKGTFETKLLYILYVIILITP